MTTAHLLLVLGGVLVLLLIYGAVRLARKRTHRMGELSDLSRSDIDPEWERIRSTMTTRDRRPRRRH